MTATATRPVVAPAERLIGTYDITDRPVHFANLTDVAFQQIDSAAVTGRVTGSRGARTTDHETGISYRVEFHRTTRGGVTSTTPYADVYEILPPLTDQPDDVRLLVGIETAERLARAAIAAGVSDAAHDHLVHAVDALTVLTVSRVHDQEMSDVVAAYARVNVARASA